MTNYERAKQQAEAHAKRDHSKGLKPDPTKYGARPGSAFDTWYTNYYKTLS